MSTEIVYIHNDRVVTDSLMVAEVFGKEHKNVMRDIRNQLDKLKEANEEEFSLLNFERSEYTNDRGKNYERYILTEDAFTLVTMSYVTVEAMKFKVKYINEFNRMKQLLGNKNSRLPSSFAEALRLAADLEEEKEKLRIENERMKPKEIIHDQIVDATNLASVKKVGKNIGIGQIKFFEFLRAVGVFYKEGDTNLPKQSYENSGHFEVKVSTRQDKEGNSFNVYSTKVTGKGEIFLANLVNEYGGAKLINVMKITDIKDYVKIKKDEIKNSKKLLVVK